MQERFRTGHVPGGVSERSLQGEQFAALAVIWSRPLPLGFCYAGGTGGVINVWLMPIFWFGLKVVALTYGTVWLRAATPRIRYDRLMALCWKYLIELAILWIMVEIALELAKTNGWNRFVTMGFAFAGSAALYGLLMLCVPKPGETVEDFR